MKIVCEACQAKYSIADDKVRGKVFKIRCKKCSHVIVVRGSGDGGSAASGELASAADVTLDAGWHIVVEGEQVGPLSEADIKGRLARSEITPDTYIWKEGMTDWVKVSTLAEFGSEMDAGPFAGSGEVFPDTTPGGAPSADVFGAQAAGAGVADLFAAPASAPSESAGGGFLGFDAPVPVEPRAGGNGNGSGSSGMTGQRHENSVLFSLSNLEALARPSSSTPVSQRAAPSATSNSEGSGLIDIRAMANMTLGASAARNESRAPELPAFSAPQFSPVAPVLLSPTSGTPKWALGVLAVLGIAIVALAVVVIKIWTPPAAAPVAAQAPVAPVAPSAVAAVPGAKTPTPSPAKANVPPVTPPPAAGEALPPREPSKAAEAAAEKPAAHPHPGGSKRGAGHAAPEGAAERPIAAAPVRAAPEAPRKPKDDIDSLLEAATGNKRSGGGGSSSRRAAEDDEPAARSGEKLPPLSREDVVKGMNAVLPKARDCYSQFKVPGVANSKITVDQRGRVSSAAVTGKFAGTPSGSCVEGALKTARFAPSAGLTFDYPIPLR